MFLYYILPTLDEITEKYSDGKKSLENYGAQIKQLKEEYASDLSNRMVEKKHLELVRQNNRTLEAQRQLDEMNKKNYVRLKKEREEANKLSIELFKAINAKEPSLRSQDYINLDLLFRKEIDFKGHDKIYQEFFFGFKNEFISKHGGLLYMKKFLEDTILFLSYDEN